MFKTDFICILTAGHTVDGREILQETLDQIAETYDPEKYNARINIDHSQNGSKLGSVLSLKLDGDKLLAQLKPNDYLLYLVQQGQFLHTSCEIVMNFAKTGKAYLTGLAVTDNPASLGTTEMHLSKADDDTLLLSTNDGIAPQKPTFLNKLLNKKDDDMPLKAILEKLTQIEENNQGLALSVTKLSTNVDSLTKKVNQEPVIEETDEKTQLSALTEKFESQSQEITTLKEQLSKISDEPDRQQADGRDQEEEVL